MKALVVYDSVYGNTQEIALAVGRALGSPEAVEMRRVVNIEPEELSEVDVLIVGSPTRAFRPTPAINRLLKGTSPGALQGTTVAAFDTRISMEDTNSPFLRCLVRLFGYAAKPIADQLVKKGGALAAAPEGFIVEGTEGPLREGELERAADWARRIAEAA